MKMGVILLPFAAVGLLAGASAASDVILVCRGDDCEVVRPNGARAGGGFTKAQRPVSAAPTVRIPIYDAPLRHYDPTVVPHLGHHHHHGCGHHYRPSYPIRYRRHYSYPSVYRYGPGPHVRSGRHTIRSHRRGTGRRSRF